MDDVVNRLRPRTVPAGYTPHTWQSGEYNLYERIKMLKFDAYAL